MVCTFLVLREFALKEKPVMACTRLQHAAANADE
jgi:hypothetical protein